MSQKTTTIPVTLAPPALDDSTLIGMALEGRGDCFAELMKRHARAVNGCIRSIVRGGSCADDVYQEVWIKAWRGLPSFRSEATFRTWLTRIALNEALMWYRRESRKRLWQSLDDFAFLACPEEPADRRLVRTQEEQQVHTAVRRLPLKYREVVTLCDLEQLSLRETARRLNATLPTVKSRLFRARHMLVRTLRRSGFQERLPSAA